MQRRRRGQCHHHRENWLRFKHSAYFRAFTVYGLRFTVYGLRFTVYGLQFLTTFTNMATIQRFEDLEIWQLSRDLCQLIYLFISKTEFSRDYKLTNQINSSSGSVMDNIAEGFDRGSRKEFIQFLSIAKASSGEVKSQLYRALDRKYITESEFESCYQLSDLINKKIYNFIDYLNNSPIKGTKFKDRLEESYEFYSNFAMPFE